MNNNYLSFKAKNLFYLDQNKKWKVLSVYLLQIYFSLILLPSYCTYLPAVVYFKTSNIKEKEVHLSSASLKKITLCGKRNVHMKNNGMLSFSICGQPLS